MIATPESQAFAEAQAQRSRTRWASLSEEERRAEMAPALLARQRRITDRKARQAAADDLTSRAFTIAMEAVAGLHSLDGRARQAALDSAATRFVVAVHDLAAALAVIETEGQA